jgi:hypothetical protein
MQVLKERIKACLASAGLRGTGIQYEQYIEKEAFGNERGDFVTYTYNAHIPECLCIDKRDQWNVGMVNAKIQNFNDICGRRIKMAVVKLKPLMWGCGSDTQLTIQFKR